MQEIFKIIQCFVKKPLPPGSFGSFPIVHGIAPIAVALWLIGTCGYCEEIAKFSFEEEEVGNPFKWKFSVNPQNPNVVSVSTGAEGGDSHTGTQALQFLSSQGGSVQQANWLPASPQMSFESQAGTYACSFWVKIHALPPEAHLWLRMSSETGSNFAGREEDIRSQYIWTKNTPEDKWVPIEFEFTVTSEEAGQLFRPHFILKGRPDGVENDFPPETRVLIDDLVITRK